MNGERADEPYRHCQCGHNSYVHLRGCDHPECTCTAFSECTCRGAENSQ